MDEQHASIQISALAAGAPVICGQRIKATSFEGFQKLGRQNPEQGLALPRLLASGCTSNSTLLGFRKRISAVSCEAFPQPSPAQHSVQTASAPHFLLGAPPF